MGVTMESKIALEGILWDLKVMSDLCLHGSIESGTKKINETFKNTLMTMLDLQSELYTLMVSTGIYKTENISEIKVSKVLNKFTNTLKED